MRERIGFWLGPLLGLATAYLPLGLEGPAHKLLALMVWVVLWWVTEPIPLPATALLGASLAVVLGIGEEKSVFALFAHPLIFLFMGGFFLARAMKVHNLDRRFALYILTRPWILGKPLRAIPALLLVTAFISWWISNTATAAMMLPITVGVLKAIFSSQQKDQDAILCASAYACSIGGIVSPIGSTPNVIAMANLSNAGVHISFPVWMGWMFPIFVLIMVPLLVLVWILMPKQSEGSSSEVLLEQYRSLGKFSKAERNTFIALLVAVSLWVVPGIVEAIVGKEAPLIEWCNEHLQEATVSMLAASLLFLLRADGKPTLTWEEAAKIDWASLILFGGGMALGTLMFETGLATVVGAYVFELTGGNYWLFLVVMVLFTILFGETTSNTATANVMVPVAIGAAQSMGVDPWIPAIAVATACSLSFMLPVSTPPNAIYYGSGMVRVPRMLKMGFVMDLVSVAGILVGLALVSKLSEIF